MSTTKESGLTPEQEQRLVELVQASEEQGEKDLALMLTRLTDNTPAQWSDWLDDQLTHGVAFPSFSGYTSSPERAISKLFKGFARYQCSSVHFQTALLERLRELCLHIAKGSPTAINKEHCKEIAEALNADEPIQNTELLIAMYFDDALENIIIGENNRVVKAYLLHSLAHKKIVLDQDQIVRIHDSTLAHITHQSDDDLYLVTLLRFSARKYSVKKYFETLLLVLPLLIERNELEERRVTNLVETLESVQFYHEKDFLSEYDSFMNQLKQIAGAEPLVAAIKKNIF